jgi:hypothetical protein
VKIKGFPDVISKELEVPNLGELLHMQFTKTCDIDDFYKNGNEYQRYLVDNTPILGKSSQVGITFQVQYLFPGTMPLQDRKGIAEEWHMDYNIMNPDVNRSHLLLSDCQCMTLFNKKEFDVDINTNHIVNTGDLNLYLFKNQHLITPSAISANRIYTFDSHIHKAVLAKKPQLRFMFRVMESETAPVQKWKESIRDSGVVGRGKEFIPTLRKSGSRIVLDHELMDNSYYEKHYPDQKHLWK